MLVHVERACYDLVLVLVLQVLVRTMKFIHKINGGNQSRSFGVVGVPRSGSWLLGCGLSSSAFGSILRYRFWSISWNGIEGIHVSAETIFGQVLRKSNLFVFRGGW